MFLTQQELHDLTDYKRPSDQIRWLTEHGYRFDVGASGRPKVLRSVVENKLENPPQSRSVNWIDENVNHWLRKPRALLEQSALYRINDGPNETGIYFLIADGDIKYAGISNAIYRRLIQHSHPDSSRNQFTRYSWFGDIPDIWLPVVESFYIHWLKPTWNDRFNPPEPQIVPYLNQERSG